MIQRAFKWIFGLFVGLLLLTALLYGGFHLWEYATGSKYVKYLTKNSETIPLDQHFSFHIMEHDIAKSKVILVGEIHGFKEPGKFDIDFFKYLHENHNVNHYFAELDFTQSLLLNEYLKSGDESLLSEILKNWIVAQGRNNKDYFNKYREFHKYFKQLPDSNKFEFVGIDRVQDITLTYNYLNSLIPDRNSKITPSTQTDSTLLQIEALKSYYANSPDTLFILSHLESDVNSIQNKEYRSKVMFNNFYKLYKHYNLTENRIYGYFGLFHIFQYRVNGKHPLASKIRKSDLGLENQILSVNFMLNDSYMVMPSKELPDFIRDEGTYTRLPVSADNMLVMYIYGIKDFKRMTPEYHKSLVKMNTDNSPYSESDRMNVTFQLLPVTDLFELNDRGKQYTQYTVFVRNSDWAEPME